jgi:hypothetical protein
MSIRYHSMSMDESRLDKLIREWKEINKPRHVSKILVHALPKFSIPLSGTRESRIPSELPTTSDEASDRDDCTEDGDVVDNMTLPQNVLPSSVGISPNQKLIQHIRQKRIAKIYSKFCDYLLFRLIRQQLLTTGYPMEKLQENNPGKVSKVSVGVDVDTASVWWDHGLSRNHVLFKEIIGIDYGPHSAVYRNIQAKFSRDSIQGKVAPWNCFSIVTSLRSFDFYTTPNTQNSIEIENFLFGLSYVILNEVRQIKLAPIGGVFKDKKQLIFVRGKIKMNHVMDRPGGKDDLIGSMLVSANVQDAAESPRELDSSVDASIPDEFYQNRGSDLAETVSIHSSQVER